MKTTGNVGLFPYHTIRKYRAEVNNLEMYINEVKDDRNSSGSNETVNGQGKL